MIAIVNTKIPLTSIDSKPFIPLIPWPIWIRSNDRLAVQIKLSYNNFILPSLFSFVIFSHLIDIQFNFQYCWISSHAEITAISNTILNDRKCFLIINNILQMNNYLLILDRSPVLYRTMINCSPQWVYDSAYNVCHWNRAKHSAVFGFLQ